MKQLTVDEAAKRDISLSANYIFDRCRGIHTFWSARLSIFVRNLPRDGAAGILAGVIKQW